MTALNNGDTPRTVKVTAGDKEFDFETGIRLTLTAMLQSPHFLYRVEFGVAMEGEAQIVLVDTPGVFKPRRRLDRAMVRSAWAGASQGAAILESADPHTSVTFVSLACSALAGAREDFLRASKAVEEILRLALFTWMIVSRSSGA